MVREPEGVIFECIKSRLDKEGLRSITVDQFFGYIEKDVFEKVG